MEDLKLILKNYGLNVTRPRLTILAAFLGSSHIFDHNDLMTLCKGKLNRVTVWRTLQLFYERKMLLKVPSSNGVIQYTFAGIKNKEISVKDVNKRTSHLQLICQDCGKIISIDDFKLPIAAFPAGFKPLFIDTIVNGKCSSCSKK